MASRPERGPGAIGRRLAQDQPRRRRAEVPTGYVEERGPQTALPRERWKPAAYDRADIAAYQALLAGTAMPHQQRRALEFLKFVTGGGVLSHSPDGPYETAFAEGQRSVWLAIEKLLVAKVTDVRDEHGG